MAMDDEVFFDDFAYRDSTDDRLVTRGWTVRSGTGGPGVQGATWSTAAVTFPTVEGRQVLQLMSSTDGTAAGTIHGEVWLSTLTPKFAPVTQAGMTSRSRWPMAG